MTGDVPTDASATPVSRRRVGMRGYLFACLATLSLLPILLLGSWETQRWQRVQYQNADQQHVYAARAVAKQLELLLTSNIRAVEGIADSVHWAGTDAGRMQEVVTAAHRHHDALSFIYLADSTMKSVATDPAVLAGKPTAGMYYGDRGYVRDMLRTRDTALSPVEVGRVTKTPNIHICAPAWKQDGTLLAFAVASVDLTFIKQVGVQSAAITPGLKLVVTDSTGRVLIHPDASKETGMADLSALPLFAHEPGDEPVIRSGTDDMGVAVRAAVASMHSHGQTWTVAVFRPEAEVASEAHATLLMLEVIGLVAVLLGLLLSAALASWLAAPIVRLAHAASHPASREIPLPPLPRSTEPREVAELLLAVRAMVQRLNAHTTELEAQVSARTAELTETQSRLALSDRRASLGTLAAGMAHEINNPLTYVISNLDFARASVPALAPAASELARETTAALDEALEGAHRVRRLVHDLRNYPHTDDRRTGPVNLDLVVEAALKLAANEVRHRAVLKVERGEVPPVEGNEPRLVQVVLNLIINAAQAIDLGASERNTIEVRTMQGSDGRVGVSVRDSGCGMDPDHLRRIFDPFFTTKAVGEGTGLGLFICQGIVTSLGGEIVVESQAGHGSCFTVWLPQAQAAPRLESAPGSTAARTKAHVLVVDDEPKLAHAVTRALGRTHDVEEAHSAAQALERLRTGTAFDVVLCDVMMPGMDGPGLYEELRKVAPGILPSLVFMTGGAFTPRARDFLTRIPNRTLEKPVSNEAILGVIADMLASQARASQPSAA